METERDDSDMSLTKRVARVEAFIDGVKGAQRLRDNYQAAQRNEKVRQSRMAENVRQSRMAENIRDAQPPQPSTFEEIANRLQSLVNRAHMVASGLEEIGARVFGPLPESDSKDESSASRGLSGTLGEAHTMISWLENALSRIEQAAARLERV